jgi:hypothetical protein
MDDKMYDALENALFQLESGTGLEEVANKTMDLKSELEIAQKSKLLSPNEIPPAVTRRSRIRVLSRAMHLRETSEPRRGISRQMLRMFYALTLAVILLLSWSGFVVTSAHALPGDQLYQAKLTLEKLRLGLSLNPQTHQMVEEEYQARRLDEVLQLLKLGRVEFVEFIGTVDQQLGDYWIIDGIKVYLIPETIIFGEINSGMQVEVEGATQPEGWVQASEIHLQFYSFFGTVESISKESWHISGREVYITDQTLFIGEIEVGDPVNVTVQSDDFGMLTAKEIVLQNTIERDVIESTSTPEPATDASDNGIEIEETYQPETEDLADEIETDGLEETPETDSQGETHEPGEPDEPDEMDEPDKPDEHDEPDETDEPDEHDEHDDKEEHEEHDDKEEHEESGDNDER